MPLRALIVDDEAPVRAKLRRLLEAERDVEIVGEATSGRQAVTVIRRTTPDVVFLDVQMPGLDGFGVIEALGEEVAPYIVFVTAFDEHAPRAFEVGAIDYLLKPYSPARFQAVLARAVSRASRDPASPASRSPYLRRILVEHDGRAAFLRVEQIDRVEAERNYVVVVAGGQRFRLRATMAALEARLDPSTFLRISRSVLVRYDAIREMHDWSHGDFRVVMLDGATLTWSRRYKARSEDQLHVRRET
jgi:two-component system LytT family response regulator